MKPSPACIELIKHFESFRSSAYMCPGGVMTIGYGSTRWEDGRAIQAGETITPERAERLMRAEANSKALAVDRLINVVLDQCQVDALVSFTYNLGEGALAGSTLRKVINSGLLLDVPEQFLRWTKAAKRTHAGLVRRRMAEAALWLGFQWEAFKL